MQQPQLILSYHIAQIVVVDVMDVSVCLVLFFEESSMVGRSSQSLLLLFD